MVRERLTRIKLVWLALRNRFPPAWTGFREKTLWDWMQLLIVPLLIAGATVTFSILALINEDARAELQRQNQENLVQSELEREENRARETALQTYLDRMTELVLDRELRNSNPGDELRDVALTRTLTVLRTLDGSRNRAVVRFLDDLDLIDKDNVSDPVITLSGANLIDADLSSVILRNANLSRIRLNNAKLRSAGFSDSDLRGADLSDADLSGADLSRADLTCPDTNGRRCTRLANANLQDALISSADLSDVSAPRANFKGARMQEANLHNAFLPSVDLSGADLCGVDLSSANLNGANLRHANLQNANLSHAQLGNADLLDAYLDNANLTGAVHFTHEQMVQTYTLVGATLPDGTKIDNQQEWVEFKQKHGVFDSITSVVRVAGSQGCSAGASLIQVQTQTRKWCILRWCL